MNTPSIAIAIAIEGNGKSTVIDILNARLADGIDLALICKQAHWNLKGREFIAVHEMLDLFRTEIDKHTDIIAERVAQLDGIALGTSQIVAGSTTLKPYPTDIRKVPDHLAALADRFADLANQVREDIDATDEAGDADAADILTAFSRELDKDLWFIKSHLE
jgi:starvation-inducible DNA-binding protein